jgi:hypothetical protein
MKRIIFRHNVADVSSIVIIHHWSIRLYNLYCKICSRSKDITVNARFLDNIRLYQISIPFFVVPSFNCLIIKKNGKEI